jgi:hypothetical protein
MSEKFITDPGYKYLLEYFPGNTIFRRFRALLTETVEVVRALNIQDYVDIRVVQKLQFLNNFRLKTAKCRAFCETCVRINKILEQILEQIH